MGQSIAIQFDQIPEETRRSIGIATCEFINRILAAPGGREALEKKKAELAERRASGQRTAVTETWTK